MAEDHPPRSGASGQTVLALSRLKGGERAGASEPRLSSGVVPALWRSSDTKRFGAVFTAALAAVGFVVVAWFAVPSARPSPGGRLALPHREAGLTCTDCHRETASPQTACTGCHGSHLSRRPAHRKLQEEGVMTCNDCHDVHGTDAGLRMQARDGNRAARATLYGPGGDQTVQPAALHVPTATVPLLSTERCRSCHDLSRADDPIAHCLRGETDKAQGDGFAWCLDEHQTAMAGDDVERQEEVCGAQHQSDRYLAWEAARTILTGAARPLREGSQSAVWLLFAGAFGGGLGFVAYRGVQGGRVKRRRRMALKVVAPTVPQANRRLPQIDPTRCLGCHACVDVCPYEVFSLKRYVAVVSRPDACCGAAICEEVCPNGSLVLENGVRDANNPGLKSTLESTDVPGMFLAGDITGLSLIKNAIVQGSRAVDGVRARLPAEHNCRFDLLIVGAGPAGISAALRAKELGLKFVVIEQDSVAQSIRSFPRGKLVFDQPLSLPKVGKLWLRSSTKEELLANWLRIVRQERLPVREGHRFLALSGKAGAFVVTLAQAMAIGGKRFHLEAACLLLAIGRRGVPRKLPLTVSEELSDKVFYHLADAGSFAGRRILIVGLGDVALEAGIALARQAGTELTMVHRGQGFTRGARSNIKEMRRLIEAGRVALCEQAELIDLDRDSVTLASPVGVRTVKNDVVFVMIGCEPPKRVLEAVGIGTG